MAGAGQQPGGGEGQGKGEGTASGQGGGSGQGQATGQGGQPNGGEPGGGSGGGGSGGGQGGAPEPGGGNGKDGEGPNLATGDDEEAAPDGERLRPPADVVRELADRVNQGEVDEKQLEDLGMTPQEIAEFAQKLKNKKRQRRVVEEEPLEPFDWGDDPVDVKGTKRGDAAQVRPGAPGEDRAKLESFRQTLERLRSEVSPEYRELLKEYYRALTEQ